MSSNGLTSMLLEELEEDEANEPTNPYRVLHIEMRRELRSELTEEQINAALAAKKEQLGENCLHRSVLESRLDRAAAFLNDWERKDDYDTKVTERQEQDPKSWAVLRFNNGVYEGFIKEGSWERKKPIKQGKGITSTIDGHRYEGMYEGNKRHGFGWQFWESGDFYRGQWKRDQMQGLGQYFYSNGDIYTGLFVSNLPHHEHGRLEWANDDVYVGEFSEGMRSGTGTLTMAEGGVYEGQWLNGKEHGHGEFRCSNGFSYTGQFEEGLFHGDGVQALLDGEEYKGTFVRGRVDGEGAYVWTDGDRYEGQFRLGQRCGEGIFTGKNGIYNGEWNDGAPEGDGQLKSTVASTVQSSRSSSKRTSKRRSSSKRLGDEEVTAEYSGQWEGGLKEGVGTVVFPSGNWYSGEFRGDRKHGKGQFSWNNGNSWTGNFWLDKQHGLGTYFIKRSSSKDRKRESTDEATASEVGQHEDLYHHGLLCERDGFPVKSPAQEDPLTGPRASLRSSKINLEDVQKAVRDSQTSSQTTSSLVREWMK